jgi:hypothetical protein
MSKEPKPVSSEAREESEGAVVFDFFYYDAARVGSYIGQLDDSGHLRTVTQLESVARSRKPGASWRASF